MLNSRQVKYLQSRPHHIKVMIFGVTMFIAGIISLSIFTASLRDTFLAADTQKLNEENLVVEGTKTNAANGSSLLSNLKANIYDVGDSISSVLSGDAKNETSVGNITKGGIVSTRVKKINPAILPVDQQ